MSWQVRVGDLRDLCLQPVGMPFTQHVCSNTFRRGTWACAETHALHAGDQCQACGQTQRDRSRLCSSNLSRLSNHSYRSSLCSSNLSRSSRPRSLSSLSRPCSLSSLSSLNSLDSKGSEGNKGSEGSKGSKGNEDSSSALSGISKGFAM